MSVSGAEKGGSITGKFLFFSYLIKIPEENQAHIITCPMCASVI
ncbi:MAG: hypothetical protein WED05_05295 [Candidatus Atabeyarchaeum deiterrae]